MSTWRAPRDEFSFILHQLLRVQERHDLPGYVDLTPEFTAAVIDAAAIFSEERIATLNRSGDEEGCRFQDGQVLTPSGFRTAYRDYVEGGWTTLSFNPRWGGQGLPQVMSQPIAEMLVSANMGFSGYIDITQATCALLEAHGSPEQQRVYLPPLVAGRWSGAMHLTESHAGSDVGLLRTRADPMPDGSYRLYGSKIFITGVDHDMSDNVVNLVLARIAGAPPGTQGISLFIVPKFLPSEDGSPGARNPVFVVGIEHKMGVRASATCSVNYEGAVGFIVGTPNEGLRAMFTMMNETRLGVGVQGVGVGEAAWQLAVGYSRERVQGRAPGQTRLPGQVADAIVQHPDVRRMLLTIRSFVEGSRALAFWTAMLIDTSRHHADAQHRREADYCVALLTPVIKAHFTDRAFDCANLALQCFGGHGYIREWGVEQLVRDIRIGSIYEGTNGIQALDLVTRKIGLDGGAAIERLFAEIQGDIEIGPTALAALLHGTLQALRESTGWIRNAPSRDLAAGASDYLQLFGVVMIGWMWLRMAALGKTNTARFYLTRTLPEAKMLAARLRTGDDLLTGEL